MIGQPTDAPPFKAGKYKHYKGVEYHALTLACHESTHEWYVVYRPLSDNSEEPTTWIRPYNEFFSAVIVDEVVIPRFTYISNDIVDAD